jgi:putative FmdB family regulatory protein
MPIYTYKCASCGFAQDEMQKMSDALLTVCPSCGKADYAKQVTAAGFALKGTGWYATDFKGNGGKPAAAKPETPSPACGTGACPACN